MKKKQTPLLAVIERSEDRLAAGRQPVMTVLRPMGPIMALAYAWFMKRRKPVEIDFQRDPREVEYVVELDDSLLALLMGGAAGNSSGDRIKLVLTPSLEAKAGYSASIGDP